jgi:hypothetical protein
MSKFAACVIALAVAMLAAASVAAGAGGDARVSVGSPPSPFSQNKQNEPAVAIDPINPSLVAAGSNDEIDLEACAAGNPTTCPFTQGVGVSGIYFSTTSGSSWMQPTYTGWTARDCLGPAPCTPHVGPIGTLPWYYEKGLVSDGDPALAWGPRPDSAGRFSWSNGERLYYANLTENFSSQRSETAFPGFEAVAVSRTDDPLAAAAGSMGAWMAPVIVTKQNAVLFSDKESIWADNAATSKYFGNVYLCNASFRAAVSHSGNAEPEPIIFARSTDGGTSWQTKQISQAANNSTGNGRQDCAVRTDSTGVVYVMWQGGTPGGAKANATTNVIYLARSFDGGQSFERPRVIATFTPCGHFDPNTGRFSFDGVAGARTGTSPSFGIANGAPSGANAPNTIVLTWCDGPTPTDTQGGANERAMVTLGTNQGTSWTNPVNAAAPSDRPDFPAVTIAPNGTDVYLDYDAFLQPWQSTTATPRLMQGVVRHADVSGGSLGAFSDLHRGVVGDARGSSQNGLTAEFLGDYNYIDATNSFTVAVWNDVRAAADCPAIDAYRQAIANGTSSSAPAVESDCPANFGNSDIYGGNYTDPTP